MSIMLHIWLRSTNCTKPLLTASHNSLIALAKQISSNCVVLLIGLSILLNILERTLNQSSYTIFYLYIKYLTFSPIVVSLLCMEYLIILQNKSLSLLNKFYKKFTHFFSYIQSIETQLLIRLTKLL